MAGYLLDTDTLSDLMAAPTRQRRRRIVAWLRSIGDAPVALSSVSIAEINRGIALLGSRNPAAAEALTTALDRLLAMYGDAVVTPSHGEWQSFARLSAVPELRSLCHGRNRNNQPRTGADVFLAIQASSIGYAVATLNVRDFLLIDRYQPLLGGIVDPASGAWARPPQGAEDEDLAPDTGSVS